MTLEEAKKIISETKSTKNMTVVDVEKYKKALQIVAGSWATGVS
jgi:hypothetical protein